MPPAKKRNNSHSHLGPTRQEIEAKFHLPLSDAAKELGICRTLLKRTCRQVGIIKWPFKKYFENKIVTEVVDTVRPKLIMQKQAIMPLPYMYRNIQIPMSMQMPAQFFVPTTQMYIPIYQEKKFLPSFNDMISNAPANLPCKVEPSTGKLIPVVKPVPQYLPSVREMMLPVNQK